MRRSLVSRVVLAVLRRNPLGLVWCLLACGVMVGGGFIAGMASRAPAPGAAEPSVAELQQRNQQLTDTLAVVKRQVQVDRSAYEDLQQRLEASNQQQQALQQQLQQARTLLQQLQDKLPQQ